MYLGSRVQRNEGPFNIAIHFHVVGLFASPDPHLMPPHLGWAPKQQVSPASIGSLWPTLMDSLYLCLWALCDLHPRALFDLCPQGCLWPMPMNSQWPLWWESLQSMPMVPSMTCIYRSSMICVCGPSMACVHWPSVDMGSIWPCDLYPQGLYGLCLWALIPFLPFEPNPLRLLE